jgi:hypothetical protein
MTGRSRIHTVTVIAKVGGVKVLRKYDIPASEDETPLYEVEAAVAHHIGSSFAHVYSVRSNRRGV